MYERTAQIFGFSEVLPLTAKDVFVWKRFYKTNIGNERNLTKECFFNMLNMSVHAHINKERRNVSFPTISSLVNSICSTIVNISVHFKHGRLGLAFSKQQMLEASTMLYEMIESLPLRKEWRVQQDLC